MKTAKVVLKQIYHPDYLGAHTPDVPPYVYDVVRTTSTLRVNVGDRLSEGEVQELIDEGIVVDIS